MILLIKRAELNKLLYCKKQLKCDWYLISMDHSVCAPIV
jgi:hypothetical protein